MIMQIIEVKTRRELRKFVEFPDKLYAECPQYVPALHKDQIETLESYPAKEYCKQKMWMAVDEKGNVYGRICAIVNPRYNELYGKKCCRFGWFDVVDDYDLALELMRTASNWAKAQGMTQIHGPLFYNTMGKQGMLVEGFQNTPQFNTIYNHPYYPEFLERMGFVKECDWVQYKVLDNIATERVRLISQRLQERYKLHAVPVEEYVQDSARVEQFLKSYSEIFSRSVYNFIPLTESEMKAEAAAFIPMLRNEYCAIICDENGDLAGFGICMPSVSEAFKKAKGRLFPTGWYHILKAMKGDDNPVCDLMLMGGAEQWEGKGIAAVIHTVSAENRKNLHIEYNITNPQIETNSAAKVWASYNSELYNRRRCYIKDID